MYYGHASGERHALARQVRNIALLRAQHERAIGTRDADAEYSETMAKLRNQFENDLVEAARRHRAAVGPVHRAFNAAMVEAEQAYTAAVRTDVELGLVPATPDVETIAVHAS